MQAAIREDVKIGKNSIIGMGSIPTKDMPRNVMASKISANIKN